ncbi:hypothetical protein [Paenibacillus qinlingensis]|uniref:hypothetical protein n=1 Tax=Paenibacillus qinlingensis TaxID=1837343 RepID=UPI00286EA168|nr:hypothetical protein [Paenibacillus qinlingensis]
MKKKSARYELVVTRASQLNVWEGVLAAEHAHTIADARANQRVTIYEISLDECPFMMCVYDKNHKIHSEPPFFVV